MKELQIFFKILKGDVVALLSFLTLLMWFVIALLPLLIPELRDIPMELSHRLEGPSRNYALGVDGTGYSLAMLIANGASTSFVVSFFTVSSCLLLGIPAGAIAGYYGGAIDVVISGCIDILLAFPPLVLPIAITAFFGGGLFHVVLALSFTGWVGYARLVRGQVMALRQSDFVLASESLGAGDVRILFRHILPNTLSPLLVQATFALAGVIIAEAGLSFLGLGVGGAITSWGSILNDARSNLTEAPHLVLFPSLALFSVIASLNFLGEAVRKTFDPRGNSVASWNS